VKPLDDLLNIAQTLPTPELARFIGALVAEAIGRLAAPAPATAPPDHSVGVQEVMAMLKVSRSTVYRRAKQLPGYRKDGGNIRFSHNGMQELVKGKRPLDSMTAKD
jgi:predicted DNA-binding transcriptional regulator AlpA